MHSPRAMMRWAGACLLLTLVAALALGACGGAAARITAPTATATPKSSVVYVALGASDALGVGADRPATQGYVSDIIAKLPPGAHVYNFGVSGIDLHAALAQEMPQAISAHPTLVTIWLAGNDFKDCVPIAQYQADLDTLLSQLRSKTAAQVFIANLPDMSALPAIQEHVIAGPCLANVDGAHVRAMVAQWNTVIAQEAARHGAVLVDLSPFSIAAQPGDISADGFHPSTAGYAQLANLFWLAITAQHAVSG